MDQQIWTNLTTLLDKGIVAGLFVFCFVLFVWKGIPFFISFLERMQSEHTRQINTITEAFENTMNQITTKFIAQIEHQHEESTKFHREHFVAIEAVKNGLEEMKSCKVKKR